MRDTKQRRMIIDYLRENYNHPSAYEIHDFIRQTLPNISLGTIYRNLKILCDENIIINIKNGDIERYDFIRESHNHLICKLCNCIVDINDNVIIKNDSNYILDDSFIVFRGLCESCNKERNGNKNESKRN